MVQALVVCRRDGLITMNLGTSEEQKVLGRLGIAGMESMSISNWSHGKTEDLQIPEYVYDLRRNLTLQSVVSLCYLELLIAPKTDKR